VCGKCRKPMTPEETRISEGGNVLIYRCHSCRTSFHVSL
jgi:predicted RNA-binding Zn-ribbon protein involved in translation (DUF1610 family)